MALSREERNAFLFLLQRAVISANVRAGLAGSVKLLEIFNGDRAQCVLVGSVQLDARNDLVAQSFAHLERFEPSANTEAPSASWLRDTAQIVTLRSAKVQELVGYNARNSVLAHVCWAGVAVAITEEAGGRLT